nr:phage protein [uncultured Haemophilus sp.]
MSREHISGQSFEFFLGGMPIRAEGVTLSISDNTTYAQTHGVPDGWVAGDVSAEGEITLDMTQFQKITRIAQAAGSYRAIPTTDLVFFAQRSGIRSKIEVFGAKLAITDLIDLDPQGGSKSTHTIKYFVTCKNFVRINGIPYLSEDDTRYL